MTIDFARKNWISVSGHWQTNFRAHKFFFCRNNLPRLNILCKCFIYDLLLPYLQIYGLVKIETANEKRFCNELYATRLCKQIFMFCFSCWKLSLRSQIHNYRIMMFLLQIWDIRFKTNIMNTYSSAVCRKCDK